MLATMMIPFPVTMVSLFRIFRWLDSTRRHAGPDNFCRCWGRSSRCGCRRGLGSAFNIFLLRQFFLTIPNELSEAARIDGCSELGIFWRIMLPLARPALAVVALVYVHGRVE